MEWALVCTPLPSLLFYPSLKLCSYKVFLAYSFRYGRVCLGCKQQQWRKLQLPPLLLHRHSRTRCHMVCAAADAAEVQRLLADKSLKTPLDFARKFLGRPYVAATLEVSDPEQVVVNLQGLDCATLVETSQALAMTRREGKTDVASYTRNLEKIRYFDGKNRGYTSRLHYLSFWMADLTKRKVAKEVLLPQALTQPLVIRLNYMSTHTGSYPFLKNHPERVREIAQLERKYSGKVGRFLPKSNAGLSRQQLGAIQDGDIITVVTQKAGLDYSHQGIAFWGNDGKLHMLHASSERKRVIADERTLEDYLKRISHAKGIRVFRISN